MTLILETESHGEVESGFSSAFTQFARVGKHTFATRHLCELVQHFAKNPQVEVAQILGYDLTKFYQRMDEYIQEFAQMVVEAEQSYLPELKKFDMERQLESQQGKISLEDDLDLNNEGSMVPVGVTNGEKSIILGGYTIAALHLW